MKNLSQYKLKIGDSEYTPLVIGAMGVDISTEALALVAAANGSIGHISDAMITAVADRHLKTHFVSQKYKENKHLGLDTMRQRGYNSKWIRFWGFKHETN